MYSVCLGVLCSPPQSVVQIKYLFSSAWLSFFQEFTTQEKSLSTIIFDLTSLKMQFTFFAVRDIKKNFLENYVFCQKSGNDTCSRRWARGEGHVVCVIMTHCVQKSICDSFLITLLKLLKKWSLTIMIKTVSQLISP